MQLVLATCLFVAHTFDLWRFVGVNDGFVVLSIFYLAIGSPNMQQLACLKLLNLAVQPWPPNCGLFSIDFQT